MWHAVLAADAPPTNDLLLLMLLPVRELECKAGAEEVRALAPRLDTLAANLAAGNLSARWLWKSGRPKVGDPFRCRRHLLLQGLGPLQHPVDVGSLDGHQKLIKWGCTIAVQSALVHVQST
jgi:hypothetical protein